MRKLLIAGLLGLSLGLAAAPGPAVAQDPDPTGALAFSFLFPGTGEWYNSSFEGGFPVLECLLGSICPCVRITSFLDAAAGRTDDGLRFDFWVSPR